jgi:hypothetical protein
MHFLLGIFFFLEFSLLLVKKMVDVFTLASSLVLNFDARSHDRLMLSVGR